MFCTSLQTLNNIDITHIYIRELIYSTYRIYTSRDVVAVEYWLLELFSRNKKLQNEKNSCVSLLKPDMSQHRVETINSDKELESNRWPRYKIRRQWMYKYYIPRACQKQWIPQVSLQQRPSEYSTSRLFLLFLFFLDCEQAQSHEFIELKEKRVKTMKELCANAATIPCILHNKMQ